MSHDVEHRALSRYLEDHQLKHTKQREAILEIFLEVTGHITGEDLYQRVRDLHPQIGYTTVYRTMKLLCEAGLAHEHNFDGTTRYEIAHQHHDHLVCIRCGKIIEFECEMIEQAQEQIADALRVPRAAPPPRALRSLQQVPGRGRAPVASEPAASRPLALSRPRRCLTALGGPPYRAPAEIECDFQFQLEVSSADASGGAASGGEHGGESRERPASIGPTRANAAASAAASSRAACPRASSSSAAGASARSCCRSMLGAVPRDPASGSQCREPSLIPSAASGHEPRALPAHPSPELVS